MNIFAIEKTPEGNIDWEASAKSLDNLRVVKMILETAQMLCTAHRTLDGDEQADKLGMYKTVHLNHPSTKWVRGSLLQYEWAYHLFKYLCHEYTDRFNKVHLTDYKLRGLLRRPPYFMSERDTYPPPPQCMPDEYKVPDDAVKAYRNYYIGEKSGFAKWAYTRTPDWWPTR